MHLLKSCTIFHTHFKISTHYVERNLNYELDMTWKSHQVYGQAGHNTHNEMHERVHRMVKPCTLIKSMLRIVRVDS